MEANVDATEVKRQTDLRDYAQRVLGLQPINGTRDRFLCPWRPGADSNGFAIAADGWYDHVADEGGDAIEFVKRFRNGSFREALRELAEHCGMARQPSPSKRRRVKVYVYADEAGRPLHRTVRYDPKGFSQERFDGKQWVRGLKGCRRVLYRLPELLKAEHVALVEGEKDADRLAGLGITATTAPMGANKWRSEYSDLLTGKHIAILADNDAPGQRHAETVAGALQDRAASVRVLTPSDRPRGDVSDWLDAGGTAEQLRDMIRTVPEWTPDPDRRAATSPANGQRGGRPRVQVAELADAFCREHRDDAGRLLLRLFQGQWFRFDGCCYRTLAADDIKAEIMEFLRGQCPDHATRHARENVLANVAAADLTALPSTALNPCWLRDGLPGAAGWLPMSNMIVNLDALTRHFRGETVPTAELLHDLTPDLFSTFGVPYAYEPEATCPKWLDYLAGVQPDSADRLVLQKCCGLLLVPETKYNVAFLLYGDAGTGKSVFLHVARHLVGPENVCCLPLPEMTHRFKSWMLTTHLVNIVGDLPTETDHGESLRHVEGAFKDVTDGGLVPVEHKYAEPHQAPAIARCLFATNSLPRFTDRTNAVWDRLRIMPFDQRFRGTAEENPTLRHEIVAEELSGVFNWASEGLALLRDDRAFPEHSGGGAIKEDHRRRCDPERVFLETYYTTSGQDDHIGAADAYRHYSEWMAENGYRRRHEAHFADAVKQQFHAFKDRVRSNGSRIMAYRGVKARECDF